MNAVRMGLWAIAVAGLVSAVVIWSFAPGLTAGFLLDDSQNFESLRRHLNGDLSALAVVTGNESGPLRRPLSMASFLLDARLHGMDASAFLRTNLALHLIGALLAGFVASRLIARETHRSAKATLAIATGVALVWALLPLHVSVVLYAVQRMAMLCGVLTLAAVACYIVGRERLAAGRPGWVALWYAAFPLLTALATLSKESGLLAPLIVAAVECGWYRQCSQLHERRHRRQFFLAFLALPTLLAIVLVCLRNSIILAGYDTRDFTLGERLLTQPRVLWDYVRQILIPFGPGLGLLHDDFPKSTGLISPWTTLTAMVAWLGLLAAAIRYRRIAPGVLGGLLWYLAAHAMESTVFPLELYFEHRNYIASLGILLATASLGCAVAARLPKPSAVFRRALPLVFGAIPLAYAIATHARASVWGVPEAREAQALANSPHSPRLRSQLAMNAAQSGDLPAALDHIAMAEGGPTAPPARTIALWRITAACLAGRELPDPGVLAAAMRPAAHRVRMTEMVAFEIVAQRIESGDCRWPMPEQAIALGLALLDSTAHLKPDQPAWRTRYNLARLVANSGDYDRSVLLAERAWQDSGWNAGVGVTVFQLHASREDRAACRKTLTQLKKTATPGDLRIAEAIESFQAFLDASSD